MAQHFLDHTQVCTVFDKMGGEGMPECMRGYILSYAGKKSLTLDHLEHGDTAQATSPIIKKEDIIKLGSNENPWGPSPKAMKAIEDEIKSINRYPESQLHELVSEIAQ